MSRKARLRGLCLILAIGIAFGFWQLGSTGLVDETPPLFASAGRGMVLSGDWLTPRVNGLPRFDKPPLVYWLMAMIYSLPGNQFWDPLGTWAARFPSAISLVVMMLFLGDTIMRWPPKNENSPRCAALITSLAFALSPLVMVWSRIAVSDSLLCGTLGVSLLFQWRRFASPQGQNWIYGWVVLGLAVLAKGPVALVLTAMTLLIFGCTKPVDFWLLIRRLRPVPGLLITALISLPWYLMELISEGQAFWDSFFGYHNFQRFTTVVNSHQEPWWFFVAMMIISALPFTPLLFLGLYRSFVNACNKEKETMSNPDDTLMIFAGSWLVSVFILFTFAATKLPSYWLPATPAAALLIGYGSSVRDKINSGQIFAFIASSILALLFSLIFWASPYWLLSIQDPEMPTLGTELIASGLVLRMAFCFSAVSILGFILVSKSLNGRLLIMQLPLVVFQLFVLIPMLNLGDKVRQLPLRQASKVLVSSNREYEPLTMVGVSKPSVHFYTKKIIVYEGNTSRNLVNLEERLRLEQRLGWDGIPINGPKGSLTALILIDNKTSELSHWKGLEPVTIGEFGIYKVWRIDRIRLAQRAKELRETGIRPNWRNPRPERY